MSIDSHPFVMDQRAFPVLPKSDRYFASESSEDARRRLTLCLERGDGPALLIGAAGCGKTMLLEVLTQQFAESFRVVRLASTQLCTRRALLQAILHGLKKPHRAHDEGELRLSLVDALSERPYELPAVALLVDEAQNLPVRLLEELRVLSNHAIEGIPRLMLVLTGTSTLDEAFSTPELETFNQRLMARCYLSPLSREETTQYVRAHIAVAGEDPDQLIDDSAYTSIFQASDGVPRLINQVCDRALLMAVERQAQRIDAEAIQLAWSDLHQLPAPWYTPSTSSIVQPASEVETGFQAIEIESDPIDYAPMESASSEEEEEPANAIEFGELEDLSNESLLAPKAKGCCSTDGKPCGSDHCASKQHTIEPVWNADQALIDLAPLANLPEQAATEQVANQEPEEYQLADELDEDEEGCIAYTFPTRPIEPSTWSDQDSPSTETDEPATSETFEIGGFELARSNFSTSDTDSLVNNPFDEEFDEEEIVLDRYTDIESFIPNAGHMVTNHQEIDFGNMFQALTPAVESLLEDVNQKIERYENSIELGIVGETPQLAQEPMQEDAELEESPLLTDEAISAISTDETEVLIVEDLDFATDVAQGAHRKDYGQLFASLREG